MTAKELNDRLSAIYERLAWIAVAEERAAWVHGAVAATGSLDPERERLIIEAERIVDALVLVGRSKARNADHG